MKSYDKQRLDYSPDISYQPQKIFQRGFVYDIRVALHDISEKDINKHYVEQVRDTYKLVSTATLTKIRDLSIAVGSVRTNASQVVLDSIGIDPVVSADQYLNATLTASPSYEDQIVRDSFIEAAASVYGSAGAESFIELLDDAQDLSLIEEFYDEILSFIFPNQDISISDAVTNLSKLIQEGQSKLADLSQQLLSEEDDLRIQEIDIEAAKIQMENEINRNIINIIYHISSLVESKHLNTQYLLSETTVLNMNTVIDYFGEELESEIYDMLRPLMGPRFKQNIDRLVATLRMNYERDKNNSINQRKTFNDANPKYLLKDILNNISRNVKISIEIYSNLVYNYSKVKDLSNYMSSILAEEIEQLNTDLASNLEQFYYYVNSVHSNKSELMSKINAKNKKRELYLIMVDIAEKANNIESEVTLKEEIARSVSARLSVHESSS